VYLVLVSNIFHPKALLKMIFLFPRWDIVFVPCIVAVFQVLLVANILDVPWMMYRFRPGDVISWGLNVGLVGPFKEKK